MSIPPDEQEHFFNCATCGKPVDMRDLGQVFEHEHDNNLKGESKSTGSKRKGDNVQWTKDKKPINLN